MAIFSVLYLEDKWITKSRQKIAKNFIVKNVTINAISQATLINMF